MVRSKQRVAIVAAIVTVVVAVRAAPAPEKYTTKYDNVDVDGILNNDRLFNSYFKCLMDEGKCTPEGEEIKRWLPDAIENKCAECSEKQRAGSEKIIKFLYEKKNDMWKQLADKYDPEGTYRQRYEEDAKKLNIQL